MPSNTGGHKPCKTCCISEVCIQSVIRSAKCPVTKLQLNSIYGTMMHPQLNADKHTKSTNHLTTKE